MSTRTFLDPADIATLTGIRTGKCGKTREQRQVEQLARMGVPHYINAAGRPIVARAAVEGQASSATPAPAGWEPAAALA